MTLTIAITAPITIVVAPYQEIPNVPPGYVESRRYTKEKVTVIECWQAGVLPPHTERVSV